MLWILKRDSSFEHPKHKLKLIGKKILTILRSKMLGFLSYDITIFNPLFTDG